MDIELFGFSWLSLEDDTMEGRFSVDWSNYQVVFRRYVDAPQSKLALPAGSAVKDTNSQARLKLGLFSYPVLQAADILLYGYYASVLLLLNHS